MESERISISSISCTRSVNFAEFLALLHSVKKVIHAKGCLKHKSLQYKQDRVT